MDNCVAYICPVCGRSYIHCEPSMSAPPSTCYVPGEHDPVAMVIVNDPVVIKALSRKMYP